MYDTIIIGGGPAGAAAAVYAGRKQMKTLLIVESFGGQSIVSDEIENWIGEIKISGFELAQKIEKHVRAQKDIEIKLGEKAESISEIESGFEVKTDQSGAYQTKTIIVASGGHHRKLGIPGEIEFAGKGVVYCSTCDAPFFRNKTVAVVGGGNSALEAVVDLFPYAKKIYLMVRKDALRGDPVTREEVEKSEKTEIMFNTEAVEVLGEQNVTGLRYRNNQTGEEKQMNLGGVFVEIGAAPNSGFLKDIVDINEAGEVVVDHRSMATSKPGIFAAGDVTDELFKQNNIAAGDAITALLSAYAYVMNIKK